jgi:hypothetical protein
VRFQRLSGDFSGLREVSAAFGRFQQASEDFKRLSGDFKRLSGSLDFASRGLKVDFR